MNRASIASDTVFALASAPTRGERGVFRLSGPSAFATIDALAGRPVARARCVADIELLLEGAWSSSVVLPARLLLFPAPASYTGEDVVEMHVLSSPPLFDLVHENLRRRGLRPASPGEFTRRAFEHGKLDLTQAEAVLALIRAEDDDALRRASRSLRESVDLERESVREAIVELLALLESGLDFSEGETGSVEDAAWVPRLEALLVRLDQMAAIEAVPERAGLPSYVLLGPPNAGKTSLWNALRRLRPGSTPREVEEGLVSTLAGTTRDLRWADFSAYRLGDAPGRADWGGAASPVGKATDDELAMLASEVARADAWIWVIPAAALSEPPAPLGRPSLRVASQCDLAPAARVPPGWISCSTRTGEGLDAVLEALVGLGSRAPFAARSTDLRERLREASGAVARALEMRESGHEIVVAELTVAVAALAPSDATEVPEELLDRIFARFCLGK